MDIEIEEEVVAEPNEVVKPEWKTPELKVLSVADAENGATNPSADVQAFS